jgi:hypothetical protein
MQLKDIEMQRLSKESYVELISAFEHSSYAKDEDWFSDCNGARFNEFLNGLYSNKLILIPFDYYEKNGYRQYANLCSNTSLSKDDISKDQLNGLQFNQLIYQRNNELLKNIDINSLQELQILQKKVYEANEYSMYETIDRVNDIRGERGLIAKSRLFHLYEKGLIDQEYLINNSDDSSAIFYLQHKHPDVDKIARSKEEFLTMTYHAIEHSKINLVRNLQLKPNVAKRRELITEVMSLDICANNTRSI